MKKLMLLVAGAIFLFASCQPDELASDDALLQENDELLMKAINAYNTHQSKTDWSKAVKNPNAYQVTKKWTMRYSKGSRFEVVPNPDACGDFSFPYLELQIDGYGQGSLFGNFTFTNRGCFDPAANGGAGGLVSDLLGVVTTAAGDQFYFTRQAVYPDPDDPLFTIQYWTINGGSEGGRFEYASGELYLRGNQNLPDPVFTGWGTFIFDKNKMD